MESTAGFYGKFPEVGDFVNRRLPKSFVEPWDGWLQSAIASSQTQLGEEWLKMYLTSPLWRFVISKGLCGDSPWFGLMMPSVDRVGRYFPLTLACRLPLDANPLKVVLEGSDWFDMAEEALMSVLVDTRFNMENFDTRVVSLGSLDKAHASIGTPINVGFGSVWQISLSEQGVNSAIPTLAHQLLLQRLSDYSLWWGSGSDFVSSSLLVCAGLPQVKDFSAMLSGDWSSGNWEQWSMPLPDNI
ncbi:type VI secretion system-associated protein TagF [Neptunomonas sp.]|uniref:type VI secretion system-associated protein TagF n=1 Tax=Neptunomonas sp. TaxID=1971898 RepID=UPI0025E828DA|nr:type VI secretion system-associated protein TagF [Neptunomonas sp.]